MNSNENEDEREDNKKVLLDCDLNNHHVTNILEKSLLGELKFTYEKENYIGDELLASLQQLYKAPLLEALNQIDKFERDCIEEASNQKTANLVTLIKGEANSKFAVVDSHLPQIYQVRGAIGMNYYLFEDINYCSCSSFKFNILHKFEYKYCKHMILIKLLNAMNKISVKYVKESEFIELIKQM